MQKKLFSRSDRVKGVDFHPTEPWLLTGLYNGTVNIYNHETGAIVKTFEVAEVPVRCVKFIARKNWFVAGSDDFQLRVFNYNTHEKVAAFEAHPDYIRCLTVHPTASIVLTGSDDTVTSEHSSKCTHPEFCVYEQTRRHGGRTAEQSVRPMQSRNSPMCVALLKDVHLEN